MGVQGLRQPADEFLKGPGRITGRRKDTGIKADVDAVTRGLCNPAGVRFRGKRKAVPGVIMEPLGDILGEAAVP